MKITKLGLLQTGKLLGVLYALFSIIMLPILLIALILDPLKFLPLFIMILVYPLLAFVAGIILAKFYNIAAKITGGLEITVEENKLEQRK